jgi:hypothetical protein
LAPLTQEIEYLRPVLAKVSSGENPTTIELYALGGMLHCFYTGVENIFKRILAELDRRRSTGRSWHLDLLGLMSQPGTARPAVISQGLKDELEEYLRFRHRFRYAYGFQLDWEEMSPLVLGCEETLDRLAAEVNVFLEGLP